MIYKQKEVNKNGMCEPTGVYINICRKMLKNTYSGKVNLLKHLSKSISLPENCALSFSEFNGHIIISERLTSGGFLLNKLISTFEPIGEFKPLKNNAMGGGWSSLYTHEISWTSPGGGRIV